SVIDRLRSWIGTQPQLRHVVLSKGAALDLEERPKSFDTVVLNSVVQYFPDMEYLLAVLQRAVDRVHDGGKVFVGDVRHLGLLRTFHSSVQLERAPAELTVGQLKVRIARALQHEKELVIDPEFFRVLGTYLPRVSGVDVEVKRGYADNEITRYRYDVTIH